MEARFFFERQTLERVDPRRPAPGDRGSSAVAYEVQDIFSVLGSAKALGVVCFTFRPRAAEESDALDIGDDPGSPQLVERHLPPHFPLKTGKELLARPDDFRGSALSK